MARKKVKAAPAESVEPVEAAADVPAPETVPAPDLADILDWPVQQLLEQSGVSVENLLEQLRKYAAANPGQAPLAQTMINFVQAEIGPGQVSAAVALLTKGLTQLMFEGKGPVAHSGCELV